MSEMELLIKEVEGIPEPLIGEVLDFVRFLKTKQAESWADALLSEQALAKDWLTSEEDEAWQDL